MSIFTSLRYLAYARRAVRALERIALAEMQLANIAREQHENLTRRKKPRPTEFGEFDVNDANARYAKELEAAEFGGTLEDRT
jgi:hypothetical protein